MKVVFIFPIIGALLGSLVFIFTMAAAGSAPQEAAGYAMAMALAVIPYVLARAMHAMTDDPIELQARRSAELLQKIADKT